MALKTLEEYLNAQGKLSEPKEKLVADDIEGEPNKNDVNPKKKNISKKGKSGVLQVDETHTDSATAVQVFRYAREVATESPKYMERLVREFKESGVLSSLVAELLEHRDTYKYIAELMGNSVYGEQISKNLARALMFEDVSMPFHQNTSKPGMNNSMDDEDMEGEEDMDDEDLDDYKDDDLEGLGDEDDSMDDEEDDMDGNDDMGNGDMDDMSNDMNPSMNNAPPMKRNIIKKPMPTMPPAFENLSKAIGYYYKG